MVERPGEYKKKKAAHLLKARKQIKREREREREREGPRIRCTLQRQTWGGLLLPTSPTS
jgi:hypothetical protein